LPTLPSGDDVLKFFERNITGPTYQPQTTPGEYARTIAEFLPGAVIPMGGGVVGNVLKYGVAPAIASETAGQITKGSAAEPYARAGTALATGGIAALMSRPGGSAALREALPDGVTPQVIQDAKALMGRAAQQGVTLSWPEALSQVAGRPVLSDTMRHLEAAPQTAGRMADFFAPRAGQVQAAGGRALDNIGPANVVPSSIGPAAGRAAEDAVNDVRGTINTATEPLYQSAEGIRLNAQEMTRARAIPGFEEARAAVRNDPQLNRHVRHLPDDSVGFLNEVKKYLDQAGQNAASPLTQGRNMQRAAGYGQDATSARQVAIDAAGRGNNPNPYETALNVQEQARRQFLEPILQGPLGRIADRDIATKKAIDVLFPRSPLPNSAAEIETAVTAVSRRSPQAATDLVRAHIESVFNEATQNLQTGANQAGGAKFAAVLVGNPQQRANLQAAVEALPNGAARWAGFDRFLEVMEATGTRQNIGSKTAYNAQFLEDASKSGVMAETAKAVTNPTGGLKFLAEKYERWSRGATLNELAAVLTDPRSAGILRRISNMPAGSERARNAAIQLALMARVPGPKSQEINQAGQ
jgi:hypothetical protein